MRAHIDDPHAADPLWAHLRDFAALGAGPCADLCVFTEETGYVAAPGRSSLTAALFAPLLAAVDHELLPDVLAGEATGTVALAGSDGIWRANAEPVKTFVPEADRVDWIAVVGAGPEVRLIPAADLPTRRTMMVDFSRRIFEVDTTSATGSTTPIDRPTLDAGRRARDRRARRRDGRHGAAPVRHGARVRQGALSSSTCRSVRSRRSSTGLPTPRSPSSARRRRRSTPR